MTEDQQDLFMLRGLIARMSEAGRKGIALAAQKLREVVAAHNDHGKLAAVLICAELMVED